MASNGGLIDASIAWSGGDNNVYIDTINTGQVKECSLVTLELIVCYLPFPIAVADAVKQYGMV